MKWNRAELLFALALLFAAPGAARAQGTAPGGPDIMTCAFNSVLPTLISGQAGYVQCDAQGRLIISNPGSGGGGAASQTASNASDAQASSTTNQQNVTWNYIFNGTTWDRLRGVNGSASTTDTNAVQTITAPGTSASKAQGVQGVTGGVPLTIQGTVSSFDYANASANPPAYSAGNQQLTQTLDGKLRVSVPDAISGFNDNGRVTIGSGSNLIRIDNAAQLKTSESGSNDPSIGIVPNAGTGSTCTTTTATTGCIVSTAANNLYRAYATAPTAPSAQQYLVCINASAVPAANAAFPAGADFAPFNLATTLGATASINFGPGPPSVHSSGTVCVISTSLTTYVAGTASIINASVR